MYAIYYSLDGLLPKMNQIYLYCEEQQNFINTLRDILNMPSQTSGTTNSKGVVTDATFMGEVQRIVMASVSSRD